AELWASDTSAPQSELSYARWATDDYEAYGGGDHVLEGGYRTLVEALADGLDIRLGTPIAAVELEEDGVRVTSAQGDSLTASHCIVTVPLGVLKAGHIRFEPALPASKQEAIDRMGFGYFEKTVLVFEEAFWTESIGGGFYFLEGFGAERRNAVFYDMTRFAGAPTLVCLESGEPAKREGASPVKLQKEALEALGKALNQTCPAPIAAHATDWGTDPFSFGSYSYAAVGSTLSDATELSQPVGGRLLFAGEATSAKRYATVHGAFLTGLREARRIDPLAKVERLPGAR
ncbi:MAG: FAD-dependent oxidoreductase, partial [Planctomycetota bacterium]